MVAAWIILLLLVYRGILSEAGRDDFAVSMGQ